MGAPLSMYQLLTKIQQNGHRLQLPFKLYAFVLYEKEQHPYIAADLQKNLVEYHQITGKDVLFFVPHADFPPQVLNYTRQYVQRYLDPKEWGGEWGVLFNPYESQHGHNNVERSLSVSSVIVQLGLRSDELPCVVVTPDLRADEFYVVPLSESREIVYQSVGEVLNQLTNNAFLLGSRRISFDSLSQDNQRHRLLLAEHHSGRRMVDVLVSSHQITTIAGENVIIKINNLIDAYERQCREYVRLMKFSNLLQDERDKQTYEYEQEILREAQAVWHYLQYVYQKLQQVNEIKPERRLFPHARQLFMQHLDGLEPESLAYWNTAQQIIVAIENLHIDENINYAPLINVLCQLIELEWNLSFVHMIREACGVTLPAAFAQVDAERGTCDIRSGSRTISFNKGVGSRGNQRWLPPGMGESRIVFDTSLNHPNSLNPSIRVSEQIDTVFGDDNQAQRKTMIDNMLKVFQKIGNWRNKASHGGDVLTKQDFEVVCDLIRQLNAYVAPLFVNIKMYYRGDNYKSIIDQSSNFHALLRVLRRASDTDKRDILTYAIKNKIVWAAFTINLLSSVDRELFLQYGRDWLCSAYAKISIEVVKGVEQLQREQLADIARSVVRDYPTTGLFKDVDSCVQFCQGRTWEDVQFWFPTLCSYDTVDSREFADRILATYDKDTQQKIREQLQPHKRNRGDDYKSIIDQSSDYYELLQVLLRAPDAERIEILTYAIKGKNEWPALVIALLSTVDRDLFLKHGRYWLSSALTKMLQEVELDVENVVSEEITNIARTVVRDYPTQKILALGNIDSCVQFCQGRTWEDIQFWFPNLCYYNTVDSQKFVECILATYDKDTQQKIREQLEQYKPKLD